jgi:hypothetical protein
MINSFLSFLNNNQSIATILLVIVATLQLHNYIKQKYDRQFKKAQTNLLQNHQILISHDLDYTDFSSIANKFPKSSKYIISLLMRFNKICIEKQNNKYIEAIFSIAKHQYYSESIPAFKEYKHIIPIVILMTMGPPRISLRLSIFWEKIKLYYIYWSQTLSK